MRTSWQLAVAIAGLILQLSPAFGDDVITNAMSSVVSYQYYDSFGENTYATVVSPIASFEYFDYPGNNVLDLQSSPMVSYYFPPLDIPPLTIIPTTRTPTRAEITLTSLFILPSQLEVFQNGGFASGAAFVNTNAMTIVLTHGWVPTLLGIPLNKPNGVESWPTDVAKYLRAQGVTANVMSWDWESAATSEITDPKRAGSQTRTNGLELGQALLTILGPHYSKPIHFIGHSFGTLVNAYAANYLQGTNFVVKDAVSPSPWPATNMQMTLFDEAEVGADLNFVFNPKDLYDLATGLLGKDDNLLIASPYYHPLPKQFAWADNYVSAFGLLHTQAVNVILNNGFPNNAPDPLTWFYDVGEFHSYPIEWYKQTILNENLSVMGYRWSFEQGGLFAQAPSNGSVYVQSDENTSMNLTPANWSYGADVLYERLQKYGGGLFDSSAYLAPTLIAASGSVFGESFVPLADDASFILSLLNQNTVSFQARVGNAQPVGVQANDAGGYTIIPASAWIPLAIPENAIAMSFNYKIQGDWKADSLAAAFNGTNILLIPGNDIETNVLFSSGSIDVSAFAGKTNELFIGIVGGTSENGQLTLETLAFSIRLTPLLQAKMNNGYLVLSWPLSAQNFNLQTTTNLSAPDSWVTLTNVPIVVNSQCTFTNEVCQTNQFFRLAVQH